MTKTVGAGERRRLGGQSRRRAGAVPLKERKDQLSCWRKVQRAGRVEPIDDDDIPPEVRTVAAAAGWSVVTWLPT
jgi:hypothetical protein